MADPSWCGATSAAAYMRTRRRWKWKKFFTLLWRCVDAVMMTVEMEFNSQREKEKFMKGLVLTLLMKMCDCEVKLEKLTPQLRELFRHAKTKKVNSFLGDAAACQCLDDADRGQ